MLTAMQIFDGGKQIPGLSTSATSNLQISVEDSGVGIKKKDSRKNF